MFSLVNEMLASEIMDTNVESYRNKRVTHELKIFGTSFSVYGDTSSIRLTHGGAYELDFSVDYGPASFAIRSVRDANGCVSLSGDIDTLRKAVALKRNSAVIPGVGLPLIWFGDDKQLGCLDGFAGRVFEALNDPYFTTVHDLSEPGLALYIEANWCDGQDEYDETRYGPVSAESAPQGANWDRLDIDVAGTSTAVISDVRVNRLLKARCDQSYPLTLAGVAGRNGPDAKALVCRVQDEDDGVLVVVTEGDRYSQVIVLHPNLVSGTAGLQVGDVVHLSSKDRLWDAISSTAHSY